MDLQLSLSLPANPIKGFHFNTFSCEQIKKHGFQARTPCFSDKTTTTSCVTSTANYTQKEIISKKRSFQEAFEKNETILQSRTRKLPLLLSTNPPNEEDDGDLDDCSSAVTSNENGGDGLVGWPPIKTRRRNQYLRHNYNHGGHGNNPTVQNGCGRASNSMFVKVKMEGAAIGRKIDLTRFHSFQPLTIALLTMFGHEDSTSYILTFQDREGDWLLATDLPWRTFTRSVQRLKLQRIGN